MFVIGLEAKTPAATIGEATALNPIPVPAANPNPTQVVGKISNVGEAISANTVAAVTDSSYFLPKAFEY